MLAPMTSTQSPPNPRVFIATITRGNVHAATIGAVHTAINAGLAHYWEILTHGPYLDNARNKVVRSFRKARTDADLPYDILLFVDSDMRPQLSDFCAVISSCDEDRPIVGGLYLNPDAGNFARPVIYDLDDIGFVQYPAAPTGGTGLHEVGAVGTGFMAIHRSILDLMAERFGQDDGAKGMPWFDEPLFHPDDDGTLGEDLTFCLRANSLGVPVYVHLDAKVGHYKEVLLLP